jgi:hypothetical protein
MELAIYLFSSASSTLFSTLARPQAYLDPGSGSYFVQLLLASLMGALFVLGVYRRKVTDFFRNLFSKREDEDDLDE